MLIKPPPQRFKIAGKEREKGTIVYREGSNGRGWFIKEPGQEEFIRLQMEENRLSQEEIHRKRKDRRRRRRERKEKERVLCSA